MSTATKLFEPYKLGPLTLPNRLVMAPLTRNRALAGMVPNPLAIEYYAQRASAGLLVTEASQVSQQGQGYQDTPGIYSKQQVAGWRQGGDFLGRDLASARGLQHHDGLHAFALARILRRDHAGLLDVGVAIERG